MRAAKIMRKGGHSLEPPRGSTQQGLFPAFRDGCPQQQSTALVRGRCRSKCTNSPGLHPTCTHAPICSVSDSHKGTVAHL
eukprot:2304988-Prymnesium_polylepis.1